MVSKFQIFINRKFSYYNRISNLENKYYRNFLRHNLSLKVIIKRSSNLIEIIFFKYLLNKTFINWNCVKDYENRC